MSLRVERVVAPDIARDLYRLRHRIYSKELRASIPAGPIADELSDSLDHLAVNYALLDDEQVVGGVRCIDFSNLVDCSNMAQERGIADVTEAIGINAVSMFGRLVLERKYRRGPGMIRLLRHAMRERYEAGVRLAIADCSPQYLRLYGALGCKRYGEPFNDPIFGFKVRILLILRDQAALRAACSPLLSLFEDAPDDVELRDWIALHRPDVSPLPSVGDDAGGIRSLIEQFGPNGGNWPRFFHGIENKDVSLLLKGAATFRAATGDTIIRSGLAEDAIYVILSGSLDVLDDSNETIARATHGPGDILGAISFLTKIPLGGNVRAATNVEILVIAASTFRRIEVSAPSLYARLMRNLAAIVALRLTMNSPIPQL